MRALTPLLLLLPLAAQAGNLRYAEDLAPAIVHPLYGSSMAEARANELAFEGLYTDDVELATTPALALSTELAADKLSDVRKNRPDVADAHGGARGGGGGGGGGGSGCRRDSSGGQAWAES